VHTRASRESPSPLLTKTSCSLWVRKRKKNLILFHPLFLSHTTIIWYCLSSVYVPFFSLSGPVNKSDRMQTWGHVQSCLEIRKCQHIYITYLTSISEFLSIEVENVFFLTLFISIVIIFLKESILNFDLNNEIERKTNRQNLLPSKYMYQKSNRIKRAHKTHKSILYLNLQIKNFPLSLSHSPYIHIKNILKKLKENCHHRYCCFYSHTHTISMFLFSGHDARLLQWERTR
jgi:hypothetical protein